MRRHQLIFISPSAWQRLLAARGDLAAHPFVALWVDKGWPLIGRRPMPGEGDGVALALPLPPSAGDGRLSFLVRAADIVATAPPPPLSSVARAAPREWKATLVAVHELAVRHGVEARVFGSLAWQALTGLDYLADSSDLDLLVSVRRHTDIRRLVSGLAEIDAEAPMRLDGELVRFDGAAVNWRDVKGGARTFLVKTIAGVALLDAGLFMIGQMPS